MLREDDAVRVGLALADRPQVVAERVELRGRRAVDLISERRRHPGEPCLRLFVHVRVGAGPSNFRQVHVELQLLDHADAATDLVRATRAELLVARACRLRKVDAYGARVELRER